MNWYKRYMGDYGRDTADLTMTQDGAYTRLLDRYYTSGQPLPAEKQQLYRIARAFERWEREAVDSVLAKFFNLTSAGYTQKRTEKELAKYKKAADVHTANLANKISQQNGVEKLEARNQIKDKDKNKNIGAKTAPFVPPDWVNLQTWKDFEEMRRRIRAPMTDRARRETILDLEELCRRGHDPEAVLAQSVARSWRGVFEISTGNNGKKEKLPEARIGAGPALPSHPMCDSPTCKMCAARRRSRERDLLPVGAGPQGRMP